MAKESMEEKEAGKNGMPEGHHKGGEKKHPKHAGKKGGRHHSRDGKK
jgi:hypothetical protein